MISKLAGKMHVHPQDSIWLMVFTILKNISQWEGLSHTRRGHKYDTGSCCRIRPFFCPPRVFAAGHKPELQKFKQQGGEIYAESTGRNKGNEMQSEAEGKKSYHHPPHAPLNQCCFSQTGDLLASKYSTASLPRIQVQ